MLFWLKDSVPLFESRLTLASLGLALASFLTWWLLPRLVRVLPCDRGRAHAHNGDACQGKPTGGGFIFVPIYLVACLLVVPFHGATLGVMGCVALAMVVGYLDDRGRTAWGEYRKAATDLGICLLAALAICRLQPAEIWLPLYHGGDPLVVIPELYVPLATLLLWISINATNCTDGVDGLSGSLLLLAFLYLGGILYLVVGHKDVAGYLLLPHYADGADWAIMAFTLLGTISGYLWHNARPSRMLMGDAGSRPLGLLLGVFVLVTGNPFLILVVAGVVLVNGGTGLVKVALLRFFKVGIFRSVRFPLHDHCRRELKWSDSQVLLRFVLLQAVLTPLLIVLFVKVL